MRESHAFQTCATKSDTSGHCVKHTACKQWQTLKHWYIHTFWSLRLKNSIRWHAYTRTNLQNHQVLSPCFHWMCNLSAIKASRKFSLSALMCLRAPNQAVQAHFSIFFAGINNEYYVVINSSKRLRKYLQNQGIFVTIFQIANLTAYLMSRTPMPFVQYLRWMLALSEQHGPHSNVKPKWQHFLLCAACQPLLHVYRQEQPDNNMHILNF